jgi:low affinity Fe/Cu permease
VVEEEENGVVAVEEEEEEGVEEVEDTMEEEAVIAAGVWEDNKQTKFKIKLKQYLIKKIQNKIVNQ